MTEYGCAGINANLKGLMWRASNPDARRGWEARVIDLGPGGRAKSRVNLFRGDELRLRETYERGSTDKGCIRHGWMDANVGTAPL